MAAFLRLVSICCAPILYLALAVSFVGYGNHVFYYGEPDFFYLFNSVTILDAFHAHYIDHPGLPLEWLGALVLAALKFFRGHGSGLDAIVAEPRLVFVAVTGVNACLLAYLNLLFGWICLRKRVPLAVILLAQMSPLFFPEFFHLFMRVTPETMIFALGFGLASAYAWLLETPRDGAPPQQFRAPGASFWCVWGAIIGVLASLKATTWPCAALLLLPLCTSQKLRWRHVGAAIFTATIVFVILFAPAWRHWPRMAQWMLDLWVHSGKYGQGENAVATLDSLAEGLLSLSSSRDFFLFAHYLGFTSIVGIVYAFRAKRFSPALYFLPLLFGLFVVVKHPHPRYLAGLSPLLLCLLVWAARERRLLVTAFLAYSCLFATPHWLRQTRNERLSMQAAGEEEAVVRKLVDEDMPDCSLNFLTQVTERTHTLYTGSMATEEAWLGRALNEKLPRTAFWSPFSEKVYRFDQIELEISTWRKQAAHYSCHLFFVKDEHEPWLRKELRRPLVKVVLPFRNPRFEVFVYRQHGKEPAL